MAVDPTQAALRRRQSRPHRTGRPVRAGGHSDRQRFRGARRAVRHHRKVRRVASQWTISASDNPASDNPASDNPAVYGLRMFGIRTVVLGVDLLALSGAPLRRALGQAIINPRQRHGPTAAALGLSGRVAAALGDRDHDDLCGKYRPRGRGVPRGAKRKVTHHDRARQFQHWLSEQPSGGACMTGPRKRPTGNSAGQAAEAPRLARAHRLCGTSCGSAPP